MIYSTGKRKTSIAKIWLNEALKETMINERKINDYFPIDSLSQKVMLPQAILTSILKNREVEAINEESIKGIASIKGNKIPQSFYDYINALSSESIKTLLQKINSVHFNVQVAGGGIKGQAESVMYGISKCLSEFLPESHKILKDLGFLTRDSRIVERKKPGLRKARKKEQYSKR